VFNAEEGELEAGEFDIIEGVIVANDVAYALLAAIIE
jgi:hypothetical protein